MKVRTRAKPRPPAQSNIRGRRMALRALAAAPLLASAGSKAEELSARSVKIVVPQTAGTTNDVIARTLAPHFAESLGRPFVVDNRVGASGMIGMEHAAKARPDGATLMSNPSAALTIPYFYKNVPFDVIDDFEPIGMEGYGNYALVVHQSVPVQDVRTFIQYAKAHPGHLNYASPGLGTQHHLCMELLQAMAGIDLVHVPYKGSAGATTDILSGQVQAMFLPIQIAAAHARGGKIKVLGGTKRERFPLFPDVVPLHEQGIDGYDLEPWFGLWGPKGLPPRIVELYNRHLNDTLNRPDVRASLEKQGLVATPGAPAELARKMKEEYALWGKVLAQMKIVPS